MEQGEVQEMKSMMETGFGDGKLSKDKELSSDMSITPQQPDEYGNKVMNGGTQ